MLGSSQLVWVMHEAICAKECPIWYPIGARREMAAQTARDLARTRQFYPRNHMHSAFAFRLLLVQRNRAVAFKVGGGLPEAPRFPLGKWR